MIQEDVNGISVFFNPWSTKFNIVSLELHEEIGGNMSYGKIKLMAINKDDKEVIDAMKNLTTGTIQIKSSMPDTEILEIPVYINKRSIFNHFVELGFMCTTKPNDYFTTQPISTYFSSGVRDAISYYLEIDDNNGELEPITDNTLCLYQINETPREFCNKLALGWRKDTVFGYSIEGKLRIRDISEEKINDEKKQKLLIGKTIQFRHFPIITRSPMLDTEPYDPWDSSNKDLEENLTPGIDFSEHAPENITSRIYKGTYNIYSTKFANLVDASIHNGRYYLSKFYSEGEILSLAFPKYRIGDVVEIVDVLETLKTNIMKDSEADPELIEKTYVIGSWDLFWTGKGAEGKNRDGCAFSVVSKIYGLDKEEKKDE